MLSSTAAPSSQLSFGNPRQIAIRADVNGAVMYTVPAGKKFQGLIYSNTNAQNVGITPVGGSLATLSYGTTPTPINLVAGTIVTSQTINSIYFIGVETDA